MGRAKRQRPVDVERVTEPQSLKVAYSARTKFVLGAALLGTVFLFLALLDSGARGGLAISVALCAAAGWAFRSTLLPVCEIDGEGLTSRTWLASRRLARKDLLGCEEIVTNPKHLPSVLIRFKTGVVLLSEARGCEDPKEALKFLTGLWTLKPANIFRQGADRVAPDLEIGYEPFHRNLLALAAVGLFFLSVITPLLWVAAIVGAFFARAVYHCCCRVRTDAEGIVFHRPGRVALKMTWKEIRQIRYWHSPVQGGVKISNGRDTIRIYRWIAAYPKFNRLLHDCVDASCFPAAPALPLRLSMNRRRSTLFVLLAVVGGAAVALGLQGFWTAVPLATLLPGLGILGLIVGTDRVVEIDAKGAQDIHRTLLFRKTITYNRAELADMRLGRQLSAGGLWIRFGQRRLEIANADCELPPEEVLACLRKEWSCQEQAGPDQAWELEAVV